jgi:hypothetical protein
MDEMVLCRSTAAGKTLAFRALRGWREKLVGLLGTNEEACPVALCGCSSVHTVGMGYPIDVALVSRNGKVLAARRDVPPFRLLRAPGAYYAFERPCSGESWPDAGSWLSIARCDGTGLRKEDECDA